MLVLGKTGVAPMLYHAQRARPGRSINGEEQLMRRRRLAMTLVQYVLVTIIAILPTAAAWAQPHRRELKAILSW